jgi:hypothetical protein
MYKFYRKFCTNVGIRLKSQVTYKGGQTRYFAYPGATLHLNMYKPVQFYSAIIQVHTIMQEQLYKSNFTVQFKKYSFTSFARSTTEQMPVLVFILLKEM